MRRHIARFAFAALLLTTFVPEGAHAVVGELIKASGPAVYYVLDGKRYVFPNQKVYLSWYRDFSAVREVSDAELAGYRIGGNVTYRPGSRLVKIMTDPKVYAVAPGGRLRWIASEEAAKALFGAGWNRTVDDIPDAFFFNYASSDPVYSRADFDASGSGAIQSIAEDFASRAGTAAPREVRATKLGTWSDGATWGGTRPASGDRVIIPSGVKVIYDMEDSGSLRGVEVGGTLEFWKDGPAAMRLTTRGLKVTGAVTVGSATEPWSEKKSVAIRLTGTTGNDDPDEGLRVMSGGTLDLHGAGHGGWTRLASSAKQGATTIVLADAVAWKPGTEIGLASTSEDPSHHERRTVVTSDGATVVLDQPLAHPHYVEPAVAAEVAPLDRNVAVLGAGAEQGSGIVVTNGGKVRLEHVALRGLGRDGRAPLVFDGVTDAASSVVQDVAVSDSGSGCVLIRNSGKLRLEGVAGVGVRGACYETATGTETRNVFRNVLAMDVKTGASGRASGMILRNPDNDLDGVSVAGSEGDGVWYRLAKQATRLDGSLVKPAETALGAFKDVSVHSAARSGLYVDDETGSAAYLPPGKTIFSGLKAALNGDYGFWIRGSGIEVSKALLSGNRVGGSYAAFGATFRDSTVAGEISSASTTFPARFGFIYEEGPVAVVNVAFSAFASPDPSKAAALGFRMGSDEKPDPRNSLRGATFDNARAWYIADPAKSGDKFAVVREADLGTTVTSRSPFLNVGCETDKDSNIQRCPGAYAEVMIALRDVSDARSVAFERTDVNAGITLQPGEAFDGVYAYATVAEGGSYRFRAPQAARFSVDYLGTLKPITLRFPGPDGATVTGAGVTSSYDAAAREVVVVIPPEGSADVAWN